MINPNDFTNIEEAIDNPYKTLQLIADIVLDYDGFKTVDDLKSLMDEVRGYAKQCISKARLRGEIQ